MKRSKYNAKPTVVDGIRFHSAKEAKRYGELKLFEKAGQIMQLILQPVFSLNVGTVDGSAFVKIGEYRADFEYWSINKPKHLRVVEDVKGFKTPLYRWKKKHVEAQYNIKIREV